MAKEGVSAEVIDLRTLRPLDDTTIMTSIRKTHKALIVDEGWKTGGISAELVARINEQAFYDLDAPVMRLCGAEVHIPYAAHMEKASLPSVEQIVNIIKKGGQHG